jgi:hypothetical protein
LRATEAARRTIIGRVKTAVVVGLAVLIAGVVAWRLLREDAGGTADPSAAAHVEGASAATEAAAARSETPAPSTAQRPGPSSPVAAAPFTDTGPRADEVELEVVDPDGKPVAGAEVFCVATSAAAASRPKPGADAAVGLGVRVKRPKVDDDPPTTRDVVADGEGRARVPWRGGKLRVSGRSGRLRGAATFDAADVAKALVLKLAAWMPVEVVDADGRPATDAVVAVYYGKDAAPGAGGRSRTDRRGVAAIDARAVRSAARIGRQVQRGATMPTTVRALVAGLPDDALPSAPFPDVDDGPPIRLVLPATGSMTVKLLSADGAPYRAAADVYVFDGESPAADSATFGEGDPAKWERAVYVLRAREGTARFARVATVGRLRVVAAFADEAVRRAVVDRPGPHPGEDATCEIRCGGRATLIQGRFVDAEKKPRLLRFGWAYFDRSSDDAEEDASAPAEEEDLDWEKSLDRRGGYVVETDAEGRFSLKIDVEPGRYRFRTIHLHASFLVPGEKPGNFAEVDRPRRMSLKHGPPDADGVIRLGDVSIHVADQAPFLADGTVTDDAGKPVADAETHFAQRGRAVDGATAPREDPPLMRDWSYGGDEEAKTDREGRFTLRGTLQREDERDLPRFVSAAKKGWRVVTAPPFIAEARGLKVVLARAAGLSGSYVYPGVGEMNFNSPFEVRVSGAGARGDDVQFDVERGDATIRSYGGRFSAYALPPGATRVSVFYGTCKTPLIEVDVVLKAGEINRDPRLQEIDLAKLVSGRKVRVVDDAGRPLIGAAVHALSPGAGEWARTAAGADGTALVPTLDGAPEIVVTKDGFRAVEYGRLTSDATITLKKAPARKITVRVDAGTAAPSPPHRIEASVSRRARKTGDATPTDTDTDGAYAWGHPLHDWSDARRVAPGGSTTLTVAHPGVYTVTLYVRGGGKDDDDWVGNCEVGDVELTDDAVVAELTAKPDAKEWASLLRRARKEPEPTPPAKDEDALDKDG